MASKTTVLDGLRWACPNCPSRSHVMRSAGRMYVLSEGYLPPFNGALGSVRLVFCLYSFVVLRNVCIPFVFRRIGVSGPRNHCFISLPIHSFSLSCHSTPARLRRRLSPLPTPLCGSVPYAAATLSPPPQLSPAAASLCPTPPHLYLLLLRRRRLALPIAVVDRCSIAVTGSPLYYFRPPISFTISFLFFPSI